MGMEKTWKQGHTMQTVLPAIEAIKKDYPRMGGRALTNALRIDHDIRIPE